MPCPDDSPYTVPGEPPPAGRSRQRRSYWEGVFADSRKYPGQWRRLVRTFSSSTAAQMASDIRSAYRRDVSKMRFRGVLPGERWDAVWEADPTDGSGETCVLWVRFEAPLCGDGVGDSAGSSERAQPFVELW